MTKLVDDLEEFTEDTVDTRVIFAAVTALLLRMQRLEIVANDMVALVALYATGDGPPPTDEIKPALRRFTRFIREVSEERALHDELLDRLDFLNQPE